MIEASPTKYYVAKYFFLGFAFIQMVVAFSLMMQFGLNNKVFFVSLLFITMSLIFLLIFFLVTQKVRRVAIGKNKIVIIEGDRNMRFTWPEVKSLKIIPFFNLYKLKLRGKKKPVYFFPSKNIDPAFGLLAKDTSKMGELVEKRKKEFGFE
jgi:hypothetical protein